MARVTSSLRPSEKIAVVASPRSSTATSGTGRAKPHVHDQVSPENPIRPSHAGHPAASARHRIPPATHTTLGADPAP